MGQCNHCTMKWIRQTAKKLKKNIVLRNGTGDLGGISVYVIPAEITVPEKIISDDAFSKKYFTAWFMELTTHCAC